MKIRSLISQSTVLLSLAATLSFADAAHATTYYVSTCGQNLWSGVNVNCIAPLGPKRTIQAAINAASNGDTVMVLPGTYFEKIDLDGKAITLIAPGGPDITTIDGNNDGPVVTCNSGETAATVIQGFRITSGSTSVNGGGMLNTLSSPTVIDCTFSSNLTSGNGAAIACFLASPTFTDCVIAFNQAGNEPPAANSGMGAGIYAVSSTITITDTFMQTCYATGRGALMALINSTASISDSDFYTSGTTFTHGEGGGIFLDNSTATIDNCLFDGVNAWSLDSQGGALLAINNSQITCTASTFYSASAETIGGAASLHNSQASFIGCDFSELHAYHGGAIHVNGGSLSATLCGFHDNHVNGPTGHGGAIRTINATTSLSLCTFTNNSCTSEGGALSTWGGEVSIGGCAFTGNFSEDYGGAVRVANGVSTIQSCTFTNNVADSVQYSAGGGGLAFTGNLPQWSTISDCTFADNTADVGGGLYVLANNVSVTDCVVQNNHATWSGGGVYFTPLSFEHRLRMIGCQITNNSAEHYGGGMNIEGAGKAFVHQTVISNNSAEVAGGVQCTQNRGTLSACRISHNTATIRGSAVNVNSLYSDMQLVNCVIHNNTAPMGGGAISESGVGLGQGKFRIFNCTIANNSGGGIRVEEPITNSTVTNSIVWGNANGGQFTATVPSVCFSNVQGGVVGTGNKNDSPLFQGALGGNYRLLPNSPCIDAGHNWGVPQDASDIDGDGNVLELLPLDFDGNPRIADDPAIANAPCQSFAAAVDMGAFEALGNLPPVPPALGDVNGDGLVNVADLIAVIHSWNACPTACCPADFNIDGVIDVQDLLTVIMNWSA